MSIGASLADTEMSLKPQLHTNDKSLSASFGEVGYVTKYVGGEPYEGAYTVTPKVDEQTMPTKDKIMVDNVTIKSIPIFNVSNTSGGSTVYIAKEL